MIFNFHTPHKYCLNGIDVTWYIMNDIDPPNYRPDILEIKVI